MYIDAGQAIADDKIFIVDGQTLTTESLNFTKAGEERNAENLLMLKGSKTLVELYLRTFEEHARHSK